MKTRDKFGAIPGGTERALLTVLLAAVAGGVLAAPTPQAPPFGDGFEYTHNTPVNSLTNVGWDADSPLAVVQSNVVWTGNGAVRVPPAATVSNAIVASGQTSVWTDCYLMMQPRSDTNGLAVPGNVIAAVDLDDSGYLQAYDRVNGWLRLSNTVWGAAVPAVTNGQWARVTVFQNYATHQCAVFLDGLVVKEQLPFVSNVAACTAFRLVGDSTASSYLDDFAASRTVPATLNNNWDAVGLTDAQEIDLYGYLAFTLNVGAGQPYTTIQSAVNAAQPRYTINVEAGSYAESVTLSQNLASLTGGAFSLSGLTLGSSVSLAIVNTAVTLGSLSIGSGARLNVTNGTVTINGQTFSGTFTLDERWGNPAARSTLPYQESFDVFQPGQTLDGLAFRGWGASDAGVAVEQGRFTSASNGVDIGYWQTLSNRVNAAGATRVWTDCRLIMAYDVNDQAMDVHTGAAFMAVVNGDGYVSLYNNAQGAWIVCSNDVWGTPVPKRQAGQWSRLSVLADYGTKRCAVFLDGVLLRQGFPFINQALSGYSAASVVNRETSAACLDDFYVGAVVPSTLTNDVNGNGMPDAVEILMTDDIIRHSSVFTFR